MSISRSSLTSTYHLESQKNYLLIQIKREEQLKKQCIVLIGLLTLGVGVLPLYILFERRLNALKADWVALNEYEKVVTQRASRRNFNNLVDVSERI